VPCPAGSLRAGELKAQSPNAALGRFDQRTRGSGLPQTGRRSVVMMVMVMVVIGLPIV